ncbi:MAG: PQQ-dependent sugar dehydrogenase [Caldilineaceae bacterium]|nr:PQQ-dependent sugar dehydrogenase [Caldilineaceae bacterium]
MKRSQSFMIAVVVVALTSATVAALSFSVGQPASAAGPGTVALTKVAGGFSRPVYVTHAGDGSGRLFVVEQAGRIKIVQNGIVLAEPFLDIHERVESSSEAGLLSVAFPPDFATSGYFFVYYNHKDRNLVAPPQEDNGRNGGYDTVVARFRVTADPNRADADSEERILLRNQPYTNHNGGLITFGPDKYLYIGLGDGGDADDPLDAGQNLNTLLGKILRIQVGASGTYTVPPTNPFVNRTDARSEIWDWGLRNPWRYSFDRATGDLFIGDVGQDKQEEISLHPGATPAGLNFGWDCREGSVDHSGKSNAPCNGPFVDPIVSYGRSEGQSVTGGYVYRGQTYPNFYGRYFFADFVSGRIWSTRQEGGGWSPKQLELTSGFPVSSFGEDEGGELYVADYGGNLYRLVDDDAPAPALGGSSFIATPELVAAGDAISYTLALRNGGGPVEGTVRVTIAVPSALTYVPHSLAATAGTANDSAAPQLTWQGTLLTGQVVTLTYQATVDNGSAGPVPTTAQVTANGVPLLSLTAPVTVTPPGGLAGDPDFVLPGTQRGELEHAIVDPTSCQSCHTEPIYGAWRGSMKSQAGRDPLFWAALHVANQDIENAGDFCLRCHTPRGWYDGRSVPSDGSALLPADLAAGVACEVCHRMVDPEPTGGEPAAVAADTSIRAVISPTLPAGHVGSGMLILDPKDNRRGPFTLGTNPHAALGVENTWRTDFLGQGGDALAEARMCGSCHNLDNPALSWDGETGRYVYNAEDVPAPSFAKGDLFPIERTFDEWQLSAYATTEGIHAPQFAGSKPGGIVRTCQDCHMPRRTGPAANGSVTRDCTTNGCLPEHSFMGANTWVPQLLQDTRWRLAAPDDATQLESAVLSARTMLQAAASLSVTLTTKAGQRVAVVRVTNETGHKLPTGYPEGRRMWIALKAYDAAGKLIYESGAYDVATAELVADTQLKVYETLHALDDGSGSPAASFHFVRNNAIIKDNRIPPRGYTQAAFDEPGLRPVGATFADGQYWDDTTYQLPAQTASVAVALYYQTASKAYVEFLRANGGADGNTLGQLWDDLKSPPELMALAAAPEHKSFLPVVSMR